MKRLTTVAPLVAVLACVAASSASASSVPVAGIQSPPDMTAGQPGDPCRALDPQTGLAPYLSNTMTGSLIGCWYTDIFIVVKYHPNGEYLAIGTEHFVGCLDLAREGKCARRDPHGTLAFIAAFEGQVDPTNPTKAISGQCQHPILSGTGDFQGATGRLEFKDNVATGTSAYQGHITLAKRSRRARATASAARRSLSSIC
jgi:hypothetical protein